MGEARRLYYARNREKLLAASRAYYASHREERAEAARRRRLLHPEAHREAVRSYMERHGEKRKAYQRLYVARRRELFRTRIAQIKLERGCADCGYRTRPEALDFDHIPERGPKLFAIGLLSKTSWTTVLAEIAKCEVVCSNCHRVRTVDRRRARLQMEVAA